MPSSPLTLAREDVARFIDPNMDYPWNPYGRREALAKADAILALAALRIQVEVGEGRDGSALVESAAVPQAACPADAAPSRACVHSIPKCAYCSGDW